MTGTPDPVHRERFVRFETNPLIDAGMFATAGLPVVEGANINGPSVIEAPSWLPDRLGSYYMYFAHHHGGSIRLAYSDSVRGPWALYTGPRSVLELGTGHTIGDGEGTTADHIASPDVHVDEDGRHLVMWFHSPVHDATGRPLAEQKSFVAISDDGLDFAIPSPNRVLGGPYFRTFRWDGRLYAMANRGWLWRAPSGATDGAGLQCELEEKRAIEDLWERGRTPLGEQNTRQFGVGVVRHVAVRIVDDRLQIYFSCVGHAPERILYAEMPLAGDWMEWSATTIEEALAPDTDHEGRDLPDTSISGAQVGVRQLRDPCLLDASDGRRYLFYSGGGEMNICGAEIFPEI